MVMYHPSDAATRPYFPGAHPCCVHAGPEFVDFALIRTTSGHSHRSGSSGSHPPTKLRVVIVEDEPVARERLRQLLEAEADVEIVGNCEDGRKALEVVQASSPDIVFLDVQMPEMDGFAFLQAIPAPCPVVIIVTAHEKHAMRAFDIHAVDFLLKPFDRERFRMTLHRARERLQSGDRRSQLDEVLTTLRHMLGTSRESEGRIAIKNDGRIVFVKPADIDWIETVGNYCEIHTEGASHMLLSTLTALEDRLPAETFARISRSTIINLLRLKELRFGHGCSTVLLQNGTELSVSAGFRQRLAQLAAE